MPPANQTSKKQDATKSTTKSTIRCHQIRNYLPAVLSKKEDGSNLGSISIFNLNGKRRGKIGCPPMSPQGRPFFLLSKPKNQDATVFKLPVLLLTIEDQKKKQDATSIHSTSID
jgi:hypothetical protein